MKRIVMMFSMMSALAFPVVAQTKVNLVIEPYPPFALGKEGTVSTEGIAVKVVHEIFRRIPEATVEVQLMPWERLLLEVREGRKDGVLLIFKKPEREEYMDYTSPIFSGRHVIIYNLQQHPKGIIWDTYEDLKKYRYGKVRGYSINPTFDELMNEGMIQPDIVSKEIQNFKKLLLKRIDFFVINSLVAQSIINSNGWEDTIRLGEKEVSKLDWYITFSKETSAKRFIPQVNQVILDMEADGTMKRLLDE